MLTLLLGPMKSGKSMDLISYFAPFKYSLQPYAVFQNAKHVRDQEGIWTRNGIILEAKRVLTLAEALNQNYTAIGIEETHMFPESEVDIIAQLLKQGTKVIASGLDTDPWGELFGVIKRLLELGPKEVRYKRAVCDDCRCPDAIYTQVSHHGEPVGRDVPQSIPDDGTYTYKAVCRDCFVRK